jgi:hypothetical protein
MLHPSKSCSQLPSQFAWKKDWSQTKELSPFFNAESLLGLPVERNPWF